MTRRSGQSPGYPLVWGLGEKWSSGFWGKKVLGQWGIAVWSVQSWPIASTRLVPKSQSRHRPRTPFPKEPNALLNPVNKTHAPPGSQSPAAPSNASIPLRDGRSVTPALDRREPGFSHWSVSSCPSIEPEFSLNPGQTRAFRHTLAHALAGWHMGRKICDANLGNA